MAVSMFLLGMFEALGLRMVALRRGLPSGSEPPMRAATVISRRMRLNTLARAESMRAFLRLVVAHFEWPDMKVAPVYWVQKIELRMENGKWGAENADRAESGPHFSLRFPFLAAPAHRLPIGIHGLGHAFGDLF